MKKIFKKALAVCTSAALSLTVGITSFASTFPDVTEESYSWAYEAVESMAKNNIIKGYEDGTFGPAKTVTKLESLVLISRILGFEDAENESLIDAAYMIYGETINSYDLNFGSDEIVYLLIKGVLDVDELEDYIGENNRSEGLKRYEVAVLLTKALDAESKLDSNTVASLTYQDVSDIPASAKKHVAYVSEQGLMQGLDGNVFDPNGTVTRAQAAVVLYKLQQKTGYQFKSGIVSTIDPVTRTFKMKTDSGDIVAHSLNSGIIYRYNGEAITINDIEVGYECVATYKDDNLYAIDFTDAQVDEVVYGSYAGMANSTSKKAATISIYPLSETDTDISTKNKDTYTVSDKCVITYNDATCSLSSLKSGYYVKLTLDKGVVTFVEAQPKETKISGRINEIILDPLYKLVIEDNEGDVNEYLVSSKVTVKKNGNSSSARDLLTGDSVNVVLNYDRIVSVSATSKTTTRTGIIKEVIISSTPRITVSHGDEDETYQITSDAEIDLNGAVGTFYDLRVGNAVTLKLESDTVVSLKTSATSGEVVTWEGVVKLVNTSYGLIQLEFVDPKVGITRNESVFIKSNASIVDYKTQKNKKLSDVNIGSKVTVTGSMESGVFEAGTVVIIG